jgi:hypothetical protein
VYNYEIEQRKPKKYVLCVELLGIRNMSPDDFQEAIDTGIPFRVYLTDGRTHDVLDMATAHVGRDAVLVGVYDDGARFPRWTMIALNNIATIEPLTPAQIG